MMTNLSNSFAFEIMPKPPYSFELTVKKPAGWPLFNPFEVYDSRTLWTATYIGSRLIGMRISSSGTINTPILHIAIHYARRLDDAEKNRIKDIVKKAIGADQDLKPFYRMAKKDSILKHTIEDLYGMHDTFSPMIFSEAVLAILLQMAPLKRSTEMMGSFIKTYGEVADFDGKVIKAWPTPVKIANLSAMEIAKRCRVGYRAKSLVKLAKRLNSEAFPSAEELDEMDSKEAKRLLLELPGIGDYSADIINPHGGFPIDVWSAEVFSKLFFDKAPRNNRKAVDRIKTEGLRRWGAWSWMAFFYVVQDLENLSKKLGKDIRLS